jgi:hypothetical protein
VNAIAEVPLIDTFQGRSQLIASGPIWRVDQWHAPALPNQMVELRQQSPLGAPLCMRRSIGAAATLVPLCRTYGDVSYPAHNLGMWGRSSARPVRFAGTLTGSVGVVVIMLAAGGPG